MSDERLDSRYFMAKLEHIEQIVVDHTAETRKKNEEQAKEFVKIHDRLDVVENKMSFRAGVISGIKMVFYMLIALLTFNFGDLVKMFSKGMLP